MTNFSLIFGGALIINVVFTVMSSEWFSKRKGGASLPPPSAEEVEAKKRWHVLLKKYLIVYLLAVLSDWLQGPYVYALYAEYGYSQHEIAQLFVAGFGSSMIFGSFVGGMADWGGRRAFVILFSIIYAASCMTKRKYFGRQLLSLSVLVRLD